MFGGFSYCPFYLMCILFGCNGQSDNGARPSPEQLGQVTFAMPVLADGRGDPAFAIFRRECGLMASGGGLSPPDPGVVVAVWTDGRIVWSAKRQDGGPPYEQGSIGPENARSMLDEIRSAFLMTTGRDSVDWSSFGPDSDYTVIALMDGPSRLRLRSWHEQFEANPNLVVTDWGVTELGDRSRDEVLAEEPEDYRQFRALWSFVRSRASAVIPHTGTGMPDVQFTIEPGSG